MKNILLKTAAVVAAITPPAIKKLFYRLGPVSQAIRRSLNKISPNNLEVIEVASGGNKGFRMVLDLQTEKDYWLGTYEIDLQSGIKKLIQHGWVVYDVGANIGYFTLMFSRLVGESGAVFAFEPLPANLERLKENLELNGLTSLVKVHPVAVIDESKTVEFLIGSSGAMGKTIGSAGRENEELYQESIEVPGIALDDFIFKQENPPPRAIKMDIEGGETLAIQGMRRLLGELKPLVFLELHGEEAAIVLWKTLDEFGYRIHKISPGLPPISSFDTLDWKTYLVAIP